MEDNKDGLNNIFPDDEEDSEESEEDAEEDTF